MFSRNGRNGGTNEERFTEELTRLKRQGASVLVVGSVRAAQRRDICRRLLAGSSVQPRRRVLVSTTGSERDISALIDDPDLSSHTVVRYATRARSSAASDSASMESATSLETSPTVTTTLAELGIAISDAIDEFEADAGGFAPAELRVGVDSLVPLVEEYGAERVFKFIHLTNGRTRDVDGMIHYHLPVDRDSDIVSVLAPLFDIVVELRERNGVFQERWSINDGKHSSGWLSIDQS